VIVFLPVVFAITSWWPSGVKWPGIFVGTGVSLALGTLLSQLGRDLGKAKQVRLFESWGGIPTTQLLAHRSSTLNPQTLNRCHETLRQLRSELRIPRSKEEELADVVSSDTVYTSCTDALRELSRDKAKYPLVFEENVNFGFRRNLWAMKPAGVAIAVGSALGCFGKTCMRLVSTGTVEPLSALLTVACISLAVMWCLRITPSWVRTAAFAYAERLLGICETFPVANSDAKIIKNWN
jgi:hypothetical protein